MATTHFSGPVASLAGFITGADNSGLGIDASGNLTALSALITGAFNLNAAAGGALSVTMDVFSKTAIADNTATSIVRFSVPNVNASAVALVLVQAGMSNASHTYDSTRCVLYLIPFSRVAGAVIVPAISAAVGAQISTVGGGQTFTCTGTMGAETGGATAINTTDFKLTDVGTPASTSDASVLVLLLNYGAGGVTMAQSP